MRSATDLLDIPYAFSQGTPLDISGFADACAQRGLAVRYPDGQLEALHRVGLLTPLYRVAKDTRALLAQGRRIYGAGGHGAASRECPNARTPRAARRAAAPRSTHGAVPTLDQV